MAAMGLSAVLAAPAQGARRIIPVTIEPPPGWKDVTPSPPRTGVFVVLKGPKTSSFVLTRSSRINLSNRTSVRTLLVDIMVGINKQTGLAFTIRSNLKTKTFSSGIKIHYIQADLDGRPRMVMGLMKVGGLTMLGTLTSAIPDTLFDSIFGSMRASPGFVSSDAWRALRRIGTSTDRQMAFNLPEGIGLEELTVKEKKRGFVASIKGLDSELMVVKTNQSTGQKSEEWDLIQQTVLGMEGVDPASLSDPGIIETAVGTTVLYASAKLPKEGGESRFIAGIMPWCYWGYTFLARGPSSEDLLRRTLASLKLGPAAVPKLLKATPRLSKPRKIRKSHFLKFAAGGVAVALIVLLILLLAPKESTVHTRRSED